MSITSSASQALTGPLTLPLHGSAGATLLHDFSAENGVLGWTLPDKSTAASLSSGGLSIPGAMRIVNLQAVFAASAGQTIKARWKKVSGGGSIDYYAESSGSGFQQLAASVTDVSGGGDFREITLPSDWTGWFGLQRTSNTRTVDYIEFKS